MSTRQITLKMGSGGDSPAVTGEVKIRRFYPGTTDDSRFIHATDKLYKLTDPPGLTDPLEIGEFFWFTPVRPAGLPVLVQIPAGSGTLLFADLPRVDPDTLGPADDPGPAWYVALQNAIASVADARPNVASERQLFVSPRGSNSNDGLDWKHAKATIAAAVTALAGDGVIHLSWGDHPLAATVNLPEGIQIRGAGGLSRIVSSVTSGAAFTSPTPGTRTFFQSLRDLTLIGPGTSNTSSIGLDLYSISAASIRDVTVSGFGYGIVIRSGINGGATYNRFYNVNAQSNVYGWDIRSQGSNGTVMVSCRANANTTGIRITDSNDTDWIGGQIEANTLGIEINASGAALADYNMFRGVRFELNTSAWSVTSSNVRFFHMLNPGVFGTYAYTDNGDRTVIDQITKWQRKTGTADAAGSWVWERSGAANGSEPGMIVRDSATSSGTPVTFQIETERSGGWFLRGVRAATRYFEITAQGQGRFASLGVGNSANATTPGTVVKKVEIFDDTGTSLGYLAVYNSIS